MTELSDNQLIISKENVVALSANNGITEMIKPLMKEVFLISTFVAGTTNIRDRSVFEEVKEGCKLSEDEVNEFCLDLPRYKRPHKVIFADVPRYPTGKIEKPKLRKIYCGESLVATQVERKIEI